MVMFQYGDRLSNLDPMTVGDASMSRNILSERAKAYLASLSALRLIEKDQAWFPYTVEIESVDDSLQVFEKFLY
jgi:hypothetical protein